MFELVWCEADLAKAIYSWAYFWKEKRYADAMRSESTDRPLPSPLNPYRDLRRIPGDVREAGYPWDRYGGAYMFTECNGTDYASLRFPWFELLTTQHVREAARRLYEASRDFPGWRTMHMECDSTGMSVRVFGGWYEWKNGPYDPMKRGAPKM